jgi:hypothetical protein
MSKNLNESVKKSKRSGKNKNEDTENQKIKVVKKKVGKKEQSEEMIKQHTDEPIDVVIEEQSDCSTEQHPAKKETMKKNAKKEPAKKETTKKETNEKPAKKSAKKDTTVDETNEKPAKKSAKKDIMVDETNEKPAKKSAKKDTVVNETNEKPAKKSAKKDTVVNETNEKPAKKSAKKDTVVNETNEKPAKKSAKKETVVDAKSTKKRAGKKETNKNTSENECDGNAMVVAKENCAEDRTSETRLLDDVEDLLYNKMRFEKNFLFYRDPHPDDFPIVRKYMQHIFGIIADGFDKFEHIRHQSMYIRVMMVHPITRKYFAEFISCHEDKNEKYIHYIRKVNDPKIVITRIKDDNSDMHEVDFELYKNTANYLLLNSSIFDYVVQLEFNPY